MITKIMRDIGEFYLILDALLGPLDSASTSVYKTFQKRIAIPSCSFPTL